MLSNSGSTGNSALSIAGSLPQSSACSSSGDSDELPEVDEDLNDEMEMGGQRGGRKHDEGWEDGMEWTSICMCECGLLRVARRGNASDLPIFHRPARLWTPGPAWSHSHTPQSHIPLLPPNPWCTFDERLSRSSLSATSNGWSGRFVLSLPVTCSSLTRAGSSCAHLVFVVRCHRYVETAAGPHGLLCACSPVFLPVCPSASSSASLRPIMMCRSVLLSYLAHYHARLPSILNFARTLFIFPQRVVRSPLPLGPLPSEL